MLTHLLKIVGIAAFVAMALGSATAEERRQQMANQCYAYGFKPNTAAFSQCLMQLDQQSASAQNREANCLAYSGYRWGSPAYNACMAVAR
jgi:hypothetical protein